MSGASKRPLPLVATQASHFTTTRTAIQHSCGPVGAPHGWLVLHGLSDRSESFIDTWARLPGATQRRVLAPEGLSRHILDPANDVTGACWGTVQDREHDQRDAFAWLDQCYERLQQEATTGARVLLGFSQGSLVAARWAVAREVVWDAVILWGAGVASNVDPARLATRSRSGKIHMVLGTRDRFATPERREAGAHRLKEAGVQAELAEFPGGHRLDDGALARLAQRFEL